MPRVSLNMQRENFRDDAQVHERRGADFHAIRHGRRLAMDIKASSPFGFSWPKICFAGRTIHAFGHEHELVDQFLMLDKTSAWTAGQFSRRPR